MENNGNEIITQNNFDGNELFLSLPLEICMHLFSFLSVRDLFNHSQSSSIQHKFILGNDFWAARFRNDVSGKLCGDIGVAGVMDYLNLSASHMNWTQRYRYFVVEAKCIDKTGITFPDIWQISGDESDINNNNNNNNNKYNRDAGDLNPKNGSNFEFETDDTTTLHINRRHLVCRLASLIQIITSGNSQLGFQETFFLTYRVYLHSPINLLILFIIRYLIPPPNYRAGSEENDLYETIQSGVCKALQQWVQEYNDEFVTEHDLCVKLTQALPVVLKPNHYSKYGQFIEQRIAYISSLPVLPVYFIISDGSADIDILDVSIENLALELTKVDWELFVRCRTGEFLNRSWHPSKPPHSAPNIRSSIAFFNHLAGWVVTTILSFEELKTRVKVMKKFILLAQACLELNNYQSVFAILGGLNSAPIQRLRLSWPKLSQRATQIYHNLESYLNSPNYKTYREALSNSGYPMIPYLGVHLMDLTLIQDTHSGYVQLPEVNWTFCKLTVRIIRSICSAQRTKSYKNCTTNYFNNCLVTLPSSPSQSEGSSQNLSRTLLNVKVMSDHELNDLSLRLEPRAIERVRP